MKKPINFLIVNMAISDLLLPIFVIPREIQRLYIDSWLIGGPLGQALCKLVIFLADVSFAVSIQSLVLIAVDRLGAVVYPLRSPLVSSKLCSFFILATWIIAMASHSPYLFAYKLVDYQGGLACCFLWNEAFGVYSSLENYFVSVLVVFCFIPLVIIAILYIIIYLKLKSHKIPGEHSVNAGQQRQQRERNVLKKAIAIVYCAFFPSASSGFSPPLHRTYSLVASNSFSRLPLLWLAQIVPQILASVSYSVEVIVKDLRISFAYISDFCQRKD